MEGQSERIVRRMVWSGWWQSRAIQKTMIEGQVMRILKVQDPSAEHFLQRYV